MNVDLDIDFVAALRATFETFTDFQKDLAKRLAAAANLEVPKRSDGSHRWWQVVATGRRRDRRFYWFVPLELSYPIDPMCKTQNFHSSSHQQVSLGRQHAAAFAPASPKPISENRHLVVVGIGTTPFELPRWIENVQRQCAASRPSRAITRDHRA